jgi:hypothetical protein
MMSTFFKDAYDNVIAQQWRKWQYQRIHAHGHG